MGKGEGGGGDGQPTENWHFQVVDFPTPGFPLWVKLMPLPRTKEPVIICRLRGGGGGGGDHTVLGNFG